MMTDHTVSTRDNSRIFLWKIFDLIRSVGGAILFFIFYFLPKNVAIREKYCSVCSRYFYDSFHRIYRRIYPKHLQQSLERTHGDAKLDPLPEGTEVHDIVIRFSGGSDSSLTAAIMAERFRKVHLVTFSHAGLPVQEVKKSKKAVEWLSKKYGEDKFVHRIYPLEDLRSQIYFDKYFQEFFQLGLYRSNACASCCLAQHVRVMAYCKKHNVSFVSDGITHVRGAWIAFNQMHHIAKLIQGLYDENGITYVINPSYNYDRSDHLLFEKGVSPMRDIKWTKNHFVTQSGCFIGRFLIQTWKAYYAVFRGKEMPGRLATRFFYLKRKTVRRLIETGEGAKVF
jgi:hypothetical protein